MSLIKRNNSQGSLVSVPVELTPDRYVATVGNLESGGLRVACLLEFKDKVVSFFAPVGGVAVCIHASDAARRSAEAKLRSARVSLR